MPWASKLIIKMSAHKPGLDADTSQNVNISSAPVALQVSKPRDLTVRPGVFIASGLVQTNMSDSRKRPSFWEGVGRRRQG